MGGRLRLLQVLAITFLAAVSIGGSCESDDGNGEGGCDGSCPNTNLTAADVQEIVARAVAEARANNVPATIAVVDRVGNVLAVVQTTSAAGGPPDAAGSNIVIDGGRGVTTGLDGLGPGVLPIPAVLAAVSKAGTGAYLSSQGNAFSTRTASQIVQENFNPGEVFRFGGPLFGVQFSQLPCGDFVRSLGDTAGPKRMPLGFSADPGGLPIYKASGAGMVPVGGIGVEVVDDLAANTTTYGLDRVISDTDTSLDERIATAGTWGLTQSFSAPGERRANRIAVDGRFLRFADDENVVSTVAGTDPDPTATGTADFVDAPGFYAAASAYLDGQTLQAAGSGIGRDTTTFTDTAGNNIPVEFYADAGGGMNMLMPTDSTTPAPGGATGGLTAAEVQTLLQEALRVANRARAQIRRPQGSTARVNFSVVDIGGNILGFIRTVDAPIFGADVSLQKARTAAFFSGTDAAMKLNSAPAPSIPSRFQAASVYVTAVQSFVGPTALTDGIAFSDRAGGNLSRPFFPDGINTEPNGPFSRPFDQWSPFSTGLQLDVAADGIIAALGGAALTQCNAGLPEIANGFQIFPGSVPIYRNGTLIGGIGISGDGVDQDDMIAFLGLHNAGLAMPASGLQNAPTAIRADTLTVRGVQLRYVSCPPKPFVDSNEQNVCGGK